MTKWQAIVIGAALLALHPWPGVALALVVCLLVFGGMGA